MKDKKKGPAAVKQTGPMRKDVSKRILHSKIREIKSQESLLLFLFVENCPKILTEPMVELVWNFMEFLKSSGYHIISRKKVFCFPLGKMVELNKLK
ncbi:hypothetical protein ES703_18637 [subsurface metagenome]